MKQIKKGFTPVLGVKHYFVDFFPKTVEIGDQSSTIQNIQACHDYNKNTTFAIQN